MTAITSGWWTIAAPGAPDFTETDLFSIPADSGFDATKPFRIQLLVQRQVAAIGKGVHHL